MEIESSLCPVVGLKGRPRALYYALGFTLPPLSCSEHRKRNFPAGGGAEKTLDGHSKSRVGPKAHDQVHRLKVCSEGQAALERAWPP